MKQLVKKQIKKKLHWKIPNSFWMVFKRILSTWAKRVKNYAQLFFNEE